MLKSDDLKERLMQAEHPDDVLSIVKEDDEDF
jgi:hypothetical protein